MNWNYEADREERRRRFLRHLPWILPTVLVVGTGLFFALGNLLVWLWRVTLVDIFGIKTISFWQAWGLILLSQILFKAHISQSMRTGNHWRRRGPAAGASPESGPGQSQ